MYVNVYHVIFQLLMVYETCCNASQVTVMVYLIKKRNVANF